MINMQFYTQTSGLAESQDKSNSMEYWLDIILRIAKFLLLTSETWSTKDLTYYKNAQTKIADSLGFIISFLYRQILISNKKEITKMITTCLEEIMTNLLVTAGYSGIKYTPQQLKQTSHKTASRELLNDEILRVTQKQKDQLRSSNYQDVSKIIFNSQQWHGVMMDSTKIEEIIECHISSEILDNIDTKKRNHAKNTNQIESTSETSIEKKASKIHREIQDIVINVNEQLFDIKNQSLINNEMARRNNKNSWHKICKELVLYKGVWR